MGVKPWIVALMATAAAIAATPEPARAGNLCVGDLSISACWRNGADHLSAAIAWDDAALLAKLPPEKVEGIKGLYRSVLGREADAEGLRTYSLALLEGWSLSKVREALAESPEAGDAIHRLYEEVLARRADEGGIKTYRTMMERGWGLHRIRRDLAGSREAQMRLQALAG
jgi:hypothetical protein